MANQIPFICKQLYEKNLIAGSDGNISAISGPHILITPSGVCKSDLSEKDLCLIDRQGNLLKGESPSTEKYMHLAVYACQSKAKAVVHAHPPSAIALSLARPDWKTLPPALPEIIALVGQAPFMPYTRPGSKKLGEALKPFVRENKAVILSHHGALTWGESLKEACWIMEMLEHSCKILCLSESMGGTSCLSEGEVKKLRWMAEATKYFR